LRNPASDLVNIQLLNNLQFEVGSKDVFENVAQVQPIIPIVLNPGLRIISRVTMQLIYQRNSAKEMGKFGVSDLTVNLLLAPNFVEDDWVFGAGPVFNFPTATDPDFGSQKWAAGPNIAAFKQKNGLVYGFILSHQWSFAGHGPSNVSATDIDPSISYTWKNGFSVDMESESIYDWILNQWTVPLRMGGGQLTFIGKLPVSLTVDGLYYLVQGPSDPKWVISITLAFVIK